MQARFEQLALEVGISVDYLKNTKQMVLIEKFAELIVKECAHWMEQTHEDGDRIADSFYWAEKLKHHFGAE